MLFLNFINLSISRPNENHMKQQDLGMSRDPNIQPDLIPKYRQRLSLLYQEREGR